VSCPRVALVCPLALIFFAPIARAQVRCTPALCGKYVPDGAPDKPCTCFGSRPGCCRYEKGCVCELECAQFGDCCPGMAGLCDHPIITSIERGALLRGSAPRAPLSDGRPAPPAVPKAPMVKTGPAFTLRGTGLGGTWLQVKLGARQCIVLEQRSDHITFALPEGVVSGDDKIVIIVDGRVSPPASLPTAPIEDRPVAGRSRPSPAERARH
jgi:hypothetical protein